MAGTHLGAAIVVGVVPLPAALAAGLWLTLGVSLYDVLRRHGLRFGAGVVTGLALGADGNCQVEHRGQESALACRVVSGLVQPWVVVLRLRCEGRRRPLGLVLAADALEPQAFRRLRARLRLQRPAG